MNIYIDNRYDKIDLKDTTYELVKKLVKESLQEEDRPKESEVSISFVSDTEIKQLNKIYRGIDKVTDVLSFPIDSKIELPSPILGDIIISVDAVLRQAEEYKHSYHRELSFLIVHGMFHLMGYDHIEREDKKVMRYKEERVLGKLGITRNYKGE